jgi:hypothetical protein
VISGINPISLMSRPSASALAIKFERRLARASIESDRGGSLKKRPKGELPLFWPGHDRDTNLLLKV